MNAPASTYSSSRALVWGLLAVVWAAQHFYGVFGHYGFDDLMGYGFYGKKWADGQFFFINEDFFSYRWGFISLTGLSYALFGVNDHSSAVVAGLVYLATAFLVGRLLKREGPWVGAVAMLLYGLDRWTVYYADKLMPDTTVSLAVLVSFALIARQRYHRDAPLRHALALVAAVFFGYLTKQSILLLFPVFFFLFLADVLRRQQWKFWTYTALGCVLVGLGYLAFIGYLTGNPLERFEAVNQGLIDNLGEGRSFAFCNYAIQPWSVLLHRIGAEMPIKFLMTGMALSIGLGLGAACSHRLRALLLPKEASSYWAGILILATLSANFMTTSYKAYLPICPDIRHFLLLVPIAAVVAAPILVRFAQHKEHAYSVVGGAFVLATLSVWQLGGPMRWLYPILLGGTLLRLALPANGWASRLFLLGLTLVLLAPVVSSIRTAHESDYLELRAILYDHLWTPEQPSIVVGSVVQKHTGQYLFGYGENPHTQFYDYSQLSQLPTSPDTAIYVLTSGDMRFRSNFSYDDLPAAIRDCYQTACPSGLDTVAYTDRVVLYRVQGRRVLEE